MSVTFYPELGPIDHHRVECLHCGATQRFDDGGTAFDLIRANDGGDAFVAGCVKDPDYCINAAITTAMEAAGDTPTVNMSNVHARHILDLLGLPADGEMVGALPPEDLLGRALIALAVAPADEGVPAHERPGPGATFIDLGRDKGYSEDRITAIMEVAQWAQTQNRKVVWT